jgi:ABC-type Fe3+/spermidine/putrescine transport system ATPase subunit
MSNVVLEVRGLTKRFGGVPAVKGIDFQLYRGETLTLLGPSGCGKSTTLRMIAGLERSDEGEILVNGEVIASDRKRVFVPAERRNMGLVFQSYAIWPHMTVADNVAYPLHVRKMKSDEIRRRVQRILELTELDAYAQRRATQLSGGQQQRVALARALVYEPDILLLDEPLSNLDAKLRHEMRVQIKQLQRELGTTILFVTHDQLEAMTLSHRIAVMHAGLIEQLGTPSDVYQEPRTHFVHSFVGPSISFKGHLTVAGARAVVEAGQSGTLELHNGHWQEGTHEVEISVRPEGLRVSTEEAHVGPNQLRAVVLDVAYAGDRLECTLQLAGTRVVLDTPHSTAVAPGQQVTLRVDPLAVQVWPG